MKPLSDPDWAGPLPADAITDHAWASSIVAQEFGEGLREWTRGDFVRARFQEFKRRDDPLYVTIIDSMGDEELARAFVSSWMVGQTIASQSRHWLELAIVRILLEQVSRGTRKLVYLHTPSLLPASPLIRDTVPLSDLGELRREGAYMRSPWQVPLQVSCLETINTAVGRQERDRREHLGFSRRDVSDDAKLLEGARGRDREHLHVVQRALLGPPAEEVALRCSLVVIEPDRADGAPHAWAIRLVNPRLLARHTERKAERVNLLRVLGYLLQEKVFRSADGVVTCVAEIVPRRTPPRSVGYADYFSDLTYWPSWRFWKFVGVPFAAIQRGIADASTSLGSAMRENLRGVLLPQPSSRPAAEPGDGNVSST